ncbi:hypothetical protein CIRMBP1286_01939 [Enterococcus cecorum]|nr:hypothetical protein CIRMBP1286_01939 [Enterococcus cecorum]
MQSLKYLEDGFNNYKKIYHVNDFEEFKEKFFIEDFYKNNELFDNILTAEKELIQGNHKLFIEILPSINNLIEKRTEKIRNNLGSLSSSVVGN